MFFAAAIAMTGLPPLSGFVGKLLILDAARASPLVWWVWGTILTTSLIAIVGFSRAGSMVFWKAHETVAQADGFDPADTTADRSSLPMTAVGMLIAMLVALTVAAGPVTATLDATAAQLFAPGPYIDTVLNTPGKVIADGYTDGEDR